MDYMQLGNCEIISINLLYLYHLENHTICLILYLNKHPHQYQNTPLMYIPKCIHFYTYTYPYCRHLFTFMAYTIPKQKVAKSKTNNKYVPLYTQMPHSMPKYMTMRQRC